MSSLEEGQESNAGITYKLLCEMAPRARMSIRYEAGVQWRRWRDIIDVIEGRGINRQIRRAYGFIASRYRPGDRIFLIGYSRGAYAVRSLAGIIDRVGLLKSEHATVRNIRQAYRHYQLSPKSQAAKDFGTSFCHEEAPIEMVGVWDTVKSLGINVPLLWRLSRIDHGFHNHALGTSITHGFHALAMDETRLSYKPVLWQSPEGYQGQIVQMWFRGSHGDIGGQLGGDDACRPLSNIPLVWMLENLQMCDVALPEFWRERFPQDVSGPSLGTLRGWGKLLVSRRKRTIGRDPSEQVHESVQKVNEPS